MTQTPIGSDATPPNEAKAPARTKPVARKTAATKTDTKTVAKSATNSANNPAVKPVAKPTPSATTQSTPPAPTAPEKNTKAKKPKMVRDSFSFPKAEYTVLQELKERSNRLTSPAKKTEILRAAIKTLAALDDPAFLAVLQSIPSLKTGRPAKSSN